MQAIANDNTAAIAAQIAAAAAQAAAQAADQAADQAAAAAQADAAAPGQLLQHLRRSTSSLADKDRLKHVTIIAGHEQYMSLWPKPQQLQLEQQQLEEMNQHLLQLEEMNQHLLQLEPEQLVLQPQQLMPRPLQQEQQRHENQWNQQQQWQRTMLQHAQHCQLFDDRIRTQQATERQTSSLSIPPLHSSVSTAAINSIESIDSQLTRMQARSQTMIAGHEQQMSLWPQPQQLQLEQQQLEEMNQHLLQLEPEQLVLQPQQLMPRPLQHE
eukprot:COSAG03_NODE_5353_length_1268_cov_56.523524_1_plen_268_part_10